MFWKNEISDMILKSYFFFQYEHDLGMKVLFWGWLKKISL